MTDGHILSLDELVAADDSTYETVEVPEWGGSVRLRSLTKQQQYDIRRQAMVGGEVDVTRVELLALLACMEEPKLSEEHIGVLQEKNAMVVNRLLKRVARLAGLDEEEAVKEAEGTFRPPA